MAEWVNAPDLGSGELFGLTPIYSKAHQLLKLMTSNQSGCKIGKRGDY